MKNRIDNLDITPGQLALDPCNASVVITDVNSGDVLAMVSYPGYDNNKMANSVDAQYFAKLNADKANPQYNYATQSAMAPGSTFKIVSATAGLMEGVIDLNDNVNCIGTFTEIVPSPRCWRRVGHGVENVTTAIRDSCNYFFYEVGNRMGIESIEEYSKYFGLLYIFCNISSLT